jgi:hypothetical protein
MCWQPVAGMPQFAIGTAAARRDLAPFVGNRRRGGIRLRLFHHAELARAGMELQRKCHDLTQFTAHFGRSPAPSHAACEARSKKNFMEPR